MPACHDQVGAGGGIARGGGACIHVLITPCFHSSVPGLTQAGATPLSCSAHGLQSPLDSPLHTLAAACQRMMSLCLHMEQSMSMSSQHCELWEKCSM